MRARIAFHGLLLALEAAAYTVLDGPSGLPVPFVEAGRAVDDRFASCREILDNITSAMTRDHRESIEALRAALERLERAHHAFVCEADSRAAAGALLGEVRAVTARAMIWM